MSVVNLDKLSNEELKRRVLHLINLEDWWIDCESYSRPSLLPREGSYIRTEKVREDLFMKEWKEFQVRVKRILVMVRSEKQKEKDDGFPQEGLKELIVQLAKQNMVNKSKVVEGVVASYEKSGKSLREALEEVVKLLREEVEKGGEKVIEKVCS